ncbi:MAG: hypothetical protein E7082_00900 [Bacteroidales bacterium]|nr:hypothetical protein [Bacteroidales bacterium]
MKKIFLIFSYLIIGSIYAIANNWAQTSDRINDLIKQEEYDAALELALPFAQRGNVNAQHIAGCCLMFEKREILQARHWFEKAIVQGDVRAMFYMGLSYDNVNTVYLIKVGFQHNYKTRIKQNTTIKWQWRQPIILKN